MLPELNDHTIISASEASLILCSDQRGNPLYAHYYKDDNLRGYTICFENVTFIEDVHIYSPLGYSRFFFKDCDFKKFTFRGFSGDGLFIENSNATKISLLDCELPILVLNDLKADAIELTHCYVEVMNIKGTFDDILLDGLKSTKMTKQVCQLSLYGAVKEMRICSCAIFEITSGAIIEHCYIDQTTYPFKQAAKIRHLEICDSHIKSICGIFENIEILNCRGQAILFLYVICLNNLVLDGHKQSINDRNSLLVDKLYVGGTFKIENSEVPFKICPRSNENSSIFINSLHVPNSNFSVEIIGSLGNPLRFNNISFDFLSIEAGTTFKIQDVNCNHLSFINLRNKGVAYLSNVNGANYKLPKDNFDDIAYSIESTIKAKFHKFISSVETIETKELHQLIVCQSDLGKMNFVNCNFENFLLKVQSSKMLEIFLAGTQMPSTVLALADTDQIAFIQQRNANSQLKKIFEQQGDYVSSSIYYANEMNAYYNSISIKSHTWEVINLWLNKWSSNHGQSWVRGLVSTLIVTIVSYIIFNLINGYTPASPDAITLGNFWNLTGFFFEFINPVHRLDALQELIGKGRSFSPGARLWDGLSRISIAYFIYQLIQAFRKHGRSK